MEEELRNIVRTFEAVGPLVGNALKSRQLFNPQAELTEPDPDILCEYDVKIPMSEGFSLTANIFRSRTAAEKGEKLPVVMCAHPYNNHLTPALKKTPLNGPPQQYRLIPQAGGKPVFSKLTSWESPDPCPFGKDAQSRRPRLVTRPISGVEVWQAVSRRVMAPKSAAPCNSRASIGLAPARRVRRVAGVRSDNRVRSPCVNGRYE